MALPDNMKGYMSPDDSLKVMNSWLIEQNIQPKFYFALLTGLLKEKGKKKIGVYLQGQANSGKTMMTNSMFNCLESTTGPIVKDNFAFQMLGGKKVVLGEEITINQTNIDLYKDLMSGSKLTCARKCKEADFCFAKIVLINSNQRFGASLTTEQVRIMKTRIFFFEDLKKSSVLQHCYGYMHPKCFTVCENMTENDIDAALSDQRDEFSMKPVSFKNDDKRCPLFQDHFESSDEEELTKVEEKQKEKQKDGGVKVIDLECYEVLDDSLDDDDDNDTLPPPEQDPSDDPEFVIHSPSQEEVVSRPTTPVGQQPIPILTPSAPRKKKTQLEKARENLAKRLVGEDKLNFDDEDYGDSEPRPEKYRRVTLPPRPIKVPPYMIRQAEPLPEPKPIDETLEDDVDGISIFSGNTTYTTVINDTGNYNIPHLDKLLPKKKNGEKDKTKTETQKDETDDEQDQK